MNQSCQPVGCVYLGLDFASISREEGHKTLVATIDDIDLVQIDRVHYLLSLLQFSLWTLHKFDLLNISAIISTLQRPHWFRRPHTPWIG